MKKAIDFILMLSMAVLAYIPCRDYAILERGSEYYGGELLVPVLIIVAWMNITDWIECRKAEKEKKYECCRRL